MTATLVIGVGNEFREDDAAGLAVARALQTRPPAGIEVCEMDGEPVALIEAWSRRRTVYVVDAVASDDPPGTIHRLEIGPQGLEEGLAATRRDSSHAVGLGEAVALARALDRLPQRLVLIGITGSSFAAGSGLSRPVRAAVDRVVEELSRSGEVASDVHD